MSKVKVEELTIEGTVYVPKNSVTQKAESRDGMEYVMVRTYSAGVHCGYVKGRGDNQEITLIDSIRIWKWSGAASLSQLAMEGTNDITNCKFGMPITTSIELVWIEVISMTEKARQSIISVESWKN